MSFKILNRNSIETGGFHGIVQKRLIVHPNYGPQMGVHRGTWAGVGNLIYLADSWFKERVATGLHPHMGIDVLTFVIEGRIDHEGSLEHGVSLEALDFQVQKSGKEGFTHNEVNKKKETARMLQLWLMPEQEEEKASFRVYKAELGKVIKVYGVQDGNSTQIEVGYLSSGGTYTAPLKSITYVVSGALTIGSEKLEEGFLFESHKSTFECTDNCVFIIAYSTN